MIDVVLGRVNGFAMYLYPPDKDCVCPWMHAGEYEPFETSIMSQFIRPGDTVIDIGAHIGYYTLLFSSLVGPTGKVIAFEPSPYNFELLVKNLSINNKKNVDCFPYAVSDKEGFTEFILNPVNSGDCRGWKDPKWQEGSFIKVLVRMIALDQFLDPASRIPFFKIDTQGEEIRVLRGMQKIIGNQNKTAIAIEYWPYGIIGSGGGLTEFTKVFEKYDCYNIDEKKQSLVPTLNISSLIGPPETQEYANLLYLKK